MTNKQQVGNQIDWAVEEIDHLRAALTASGMGRMRECTVCKATVAEYPEGMCCHCQELPWPVRTALQDNDGGGGGNG